MAQAGAYPQAGAYAPAPGVYPGVYQQAPGYIPQTAQPSTIVVQQAPAARPPDNLIFSLVACIFCNSFCLGLIALVCAYQSQQEANRNNMEIARSKGDTAKKLAIAGIVITAIITVIIIILRVTLYTTHGIIIG